MSFCVHACLLVYISYNTSPYYTGLGTLERLPATYLLLGLDFMVTSDYHVWFIEANNTPLWPSFVSDSYTMGVSITYSL